VQPYLQILTTHHGVACSYICKRVCLRFSERLDVHGIFLIKVPVFSSVTEALVLVVRLIMLSTIN